MTLRFYHTWFLWPSVVTCATDINRNPSFSKMIDLDMALGSSLGCMSSQSLWQLRPPRSIWPSGSMALSTTILSQVADQTSNIFMVTGAMNIN